MPARRSSQLASTTVAALDNLSLLQGAIERAREECIGNGPILGERPHGSFSLHEYAAHLNLPQDTANGHLQRLLRDGKYQRVMAYGQVPTQNLNGFRMQAMWFYSPKQKE